jgi:hypothetical protein
MIGRVARQVHRGRLHGPNRKHLVILEQEIKHPVVLFTGDPIPLAEETLHLSDPLPDPHRRLVPFLSSGQPFLQIERGRQVVSMGMGLEDVGDGVALGADKRKEGVGGAGGYRARALVVVEDRVDDDCCLGRWVGNDVLPCGGLWLEEWVNGRFRGGG